MKVPLSWLREFVDIELSVEQLAHILTQAGLEVEELRYVGYPMGQASDSHASVSGLAWDPEMIVVGEIREVMPHPDADRLVLTRLYDGTAEHTVLTGAPNLLPFRGSGALERPLKVAYARQGARIYDGKQPGWQEMTLKPAVIRGVESSSMACSEKELGISEDHEGIIVLDDDAQPGTPLVDYMGDVVLDIAILPNIARDANILGVAREVAALTGTELREPSYEVDWAGPAIVGQVSLEIREPQLNPRFVLGLIDGVEIKPSPYWVQRRLRLAGMRPINNIVDATNYVMLEVGQPLHAFDYEVLVKRAGGKPPTIITRLPEPNESLTTLDGITRELDDFTILVADTAGALSIGGVMGGAESEVSASTHRVLLEGAAWDFINIRKTTGAQRLSSEAAYRFQRGVHLAMAERGVRRGLELIRRLSGGTVAEGLVDQYPLPPRPAVIEISPDDVERWLGARLEIDQMADILTRLQFSVQAGQDQLRVTPPDHRLDIGEGVVGVADLIEEIARVHGYEQIPETQIEDRIPPQYGNPDLELEERIRDLLVAMGLQEIVTVRLTSPEREARATAEVGLGWPEYVRIVNPIAEDRVVLRRSMLVSILETVERNLRSANRIALFDIGPVFLPVAGQQLPEEPSRLSLALTGARSEQDWRRSGSHLLDFFDLKGLVEQLLAGLHVPEVGFRPARHPSYHPGKCAELTLAGEPAGVIGEVHPVVSERFSITEAPLAAAELDLDQIKAAVPLRYPVLPVPNFPPVLEDLAFIVDEQVPAEDLRRLIFETGQPLLSQVRVFDLYRGDQVGMGKKSLAFSLTYQAHDRTLTDDEVAKSRRKIVKKVEQDTGAVLRERAE